MLNSRNRRFCWSLFGYIFQYCSKKPLLFCKRNLVLGLSKSLLFMKKSVLLILGNYFILYIRKEHRFLLSFNLRTTLKNNYRTNLELFRQASTLSKILKDKQKSQSCRWKSYSSSSKDVWAKISKIGALKSSWSNIFPKSI